MSHPEYFPVDAKGHLGIQTFLKYNLLFRSTHFFFSLLISTQATRQLPVFTLKMLVVVFPFKSIHSIFHWGYNELFCCALFIVK